MSHTYGYTPSGTISVTANPTFTGTSDKTDGMSANSKGSWGGTDGGFLGKTSQQSGNVYNEYLRNFDGNGGYPHLFKVTQDISHTHNFKPSGSISGGSYKFTGTAGTTGGSSASNTGKTGSGTAVNILPPYVAKYCWERTA